MGMSEPCTLTDIGIMAEEGLIDLENSDIMLYTELRDKNGAPIYDGDILLLPCGEKAEVCFCLGAYGILWNGFKPFTECNASQYEVIGNVYENPELLKG